MQNLNLSASVYSVEQLDVIMKYNIDIIYIPFDLFVSGVCSVSTIDEIHHNYDTKVYLSTPRIVRKRDEKYLSKFKDFLLLGKADGILVKNLESLGFVLSIKEDLEKEYISINGEIEDYTSLFLTLDANMYNWNRSAIAFNRRFADSLTCPLELSIHEMKELEDNSLNVVVYGRAPLMVSANCVKKSSNNCTMGCVPEHFDWVLRDRMKKNHFVYCNCIHCYNEIFNAVPTSYHKQITELNKNGFYNLRLDFTDEEARLTDKIMKYYKNNAKGEFPLSDYTTGHILKGAI